MKTEYQTKKAEYLAAREPALARRPVLHLKHPPARPVEAPQGASQDQAPTLGASTVENGSNEESM